MEQLARQAGPDDLEVLAKWSGWGALPEVFDERSTAPYALRTRRFLEERLDTEEFRAAARSTLNAHYTSPVVAEQMWRTLTDLGWEGSTVWEPGVGIGVFPATAPTGVQVTGIELDPLTARLAARLHPGHEIINQDLVAASVDGSFHAAIGNVPFASVKPHDPTWNPGRKLSLHNYAITKALAAVEPDAPVFVITSSFTLDAASPAQRDALSSYGEFLGAMRLPSSTFEDHSGTSVTTDMVLFRRLRENETTSADHWRSVEPMDIEGETVMVNRWYHDHPDLVVGEWSLDEVNMGRAAGVTLNSDQLAERLEAATDQLVRGLGQPFSNRARLDVIPPSAAVASLEVEIPLWVKPGGVFGDSRDGFYQRPVDGGPAEPFTVKPKKDEFTLELLIDVRDSYMQLVEAEVADSPHVEDLRGQLNRAYDRFVSTAGPINQQSVSVRRDGVEVTRRPAFGGFRLADPDFATVAGIELYDRSTGEATKSAIFSERQIRPVLIAEIETPEDAVVVSLHRRGHIDPELVADLLQIAPEEVNDRLAGVAFVDPDTSTLVDRPTYLSGNVRAKLASAIEAGEGFEAHVEALKSVVPSDLPVDEIGVELGVAWLKPDEVLQFMRDTFDEPLVNAELTYNRTVGWVTDFGRHTKSVTESLASTWGTSRMNAVELVDAGLANRAIKVYDTQQPEGRRVLNYAETVSANQKLDQINRALRDWIADDPERSATIAGRYNQLFRSHAAPDYSSWPRPPGLANDITLRPHQSNAVTRMVLSKQVGLYHVVGAGKTYTMAAAAMEARRLGLANKPMLVAPSHLVDQIAGEWQRAFPNARLLVQNESTPQSRTRLVAQASAGDWDGIIVSGNTFAGIPVSPKTEAAYIQLRADELREALNAVGHVSDSRSLKQIEKRVASAEERVKELQDKKTDPALQFDRMGVDALFVDEAHYYKNLEIITGRDDLAVAPSQRALDMDMKLGLLRSSNPDPLIMMSTGTPISNSFHEMWVMMRYTDPELLAATGLDRFDAFASQFGEIVTDYEMKPTGKFALTSRFASFKNVPELSAMFAQTADVRLAADLDLPRPKIEGGQPQHLRIPTSPQLQQFMQSLEARSNNLDPRNPKEDNHLMIMTDARKAAVSLELVGWTDPEINKISSVADSVSHRYWAEADLVYKDPRTGAPHPVPGSLQIVFLDQGVPGSPAGDLYARLRRELAERGVPSEKVAFVHDAKRHELQDLFRRAREGGVSVLIGSTSKMGTGMNAQTRVTALYHVDPAWRPADMEQRNGRAVRQGNQNPQVAITYVVNEGSGDVLMYQGLERKAKMIDQVLTNRNDHRTIEAPDSDQTTFGDLKALATGDPRVLDLLKAQRALGEIDIAYGEWDRRTSRARRQIPKLKASIESYEAQKTRLQDALAKFPDRAFTVRPLQPNPEISTKDAIANHVPAASTGRPSKVAVAASLSNPGESMTIFAETSRDSFGRRVAFTTEELGELFRVDFAEIPTMNLGVRLTNSLERAFDSLDTLDDQIAQTNRNLVAATRNSASTFDRSEERDAIRTNVLKLQEDLAGVTGEEPTEHHPTPSEPVNIKSTQGGIRPSGPDAGRLSAHHRNNPKDRRASPNQNANRATPGSPEPKPRRPRP